MQVFHKHFERLHTVTVLDSEDEEDGLTDGNGNVERVDQIVPAKTEHASNIESDDDENCASSDNGARKKHVPFLTDFEKLKATIGNANLPLPSTSSSILSSGSSVPNIGPAASADGASIENEPQPNGNGNGSEDENSNDMLAAAAPQMNPSLPVAVPKRANARIVPSPSPGKSPKENQPNQSTTNELGAPAIPTKPTLN